MARSDGNTANEQVNCDLHLPNTLDTYMGEWASANVQPCSECCYAWEHIFMHSPPFPASPVYPSAWGLLACFQDLPAMATGCHLLGNSGSYWMPQEPDLHYLGMQTLIIIKQLFSMKLDGLVSTDICSVKKFGRSSHKGTFIDILSHTCDRRLFNYYSYM